MTVGRPSEPIRPRLAELLDRAEQRIAQRRAELDLIHDRIRAFRAAAVMPGALVSSFAALCAFRLRDLTGA